MNNLRILHDNAGDRAVLAATSQAGALGPANLQRDERSAVWRTQGRSVLLDVNWAAPELLACLALVRTNLRSCARVRVRGWSVPGDASPAIDTGWVQPCREAPLDTYPFGVLPLGWNAHRWGGVNTWARGGGADAAVWFDPVHVRRLVVEIWAEQSIEPYIEISRLVIGNYWSPEYNAEYGAQLQIQDSSESYRTAAGEQKTAVGTISSQLSVSLAYITPTDRARLMRIVRECGAVRPLLFSLFPENPDPLIEQDHTLYGRATNLDAISASSFDIYSAPLQIEGI
ncbi:hypothetical protein [Duganella phyllosphaerae]|uniref:Uncharacterized protein n=1 Tax=Duganella phyllosphaerae TaxID=762836 RepID=A0A1E7X6V7_9BURK|nr:hypothetical protein [Duganella phyllosphaerae]OFA08845.1 hypothetical protein DUPY_04520 [Duganella phyllosphaerae]